MLETREVITKVGVIFCNLCNQINEKCVDMIVSAANFARSNSNSKCPQISSYVWMILVWRIKDDSPNSPNFPTIRCISKQKIVMPKS